MMHDMWPGGWVVWCVWRLALFVSQTKTDDKLITTLRHLECDGENIK